MSVPPQIMNMMRGAGAGPQMAPPPQASGAPGNAPPLASPMNTPQRNAGDMAAATVKVRIGIKFLEQCLPAFGSMSKEGKGLMEALTKLSKVFGRDAEDAEGLEPSEIMQMFATLPRTGGGGPSQQAVMQQMAKGATPPAPTSTPASTMQ